MATQKSSPNKVSSRLIDYVCFVGVDKSEVSFHDAPFSLYQPQLLKRYPPTDHKDFVLPTECVNFCQPDGCKVIQMKKGRNKEINSFAFTLTDKDSGLTRYGVSYNFYRLLKEETVSPKHPKVDDQADGESDPNHQAWMNKTSSDSAFSSDYRKADSECDDGSITPKPKHLSSKSGNKRENGSATPLQSTTETTKSPKSNGAAKQGGRRKTQTRSKSSLSSSQNIISNASDDDSDVENGVPGVDKTLKNNRRKRNEKEKAKYYGLTSLCIVSHFQFFFKFRECLEILRQLLDAVVPCSMTRSLCNKCSHHVSPINVRKGSPNKPNTRSRRKLHSSWDLLLNHNHQQQSISSGASQRDKVNFRGNTSTLEVQSSTPCVAQNIKMIETWISNLLMLPVPSPGQTKVEVDLLPSKLQSGSLTFALPDSIDRFSYSDFPIHLPLELLGVDVFIQVLNLVLSEKKLLMKSQDYSALTFCIMAFQRLIYPLEYVFPVIPLLPSCMPNSEQLLLAPTPFIIGITSEFMTQKKLRALPNDIWEIDIDSAVISPPPGSSLTELHSFPEPEGKILRYHLKQVLDSIAIQPIKNFEDLSPENLAKMARNQNTLVEPINPEYHLPFIFGNDVDSIDVATRVAMVNFFMSPNLLENFAEHTKVIRLYPRPIVTVKSTSFLNSKPKDSNFLMNFSSSQAVLFFAEWSILPTNRAYQKVREGIYDPSLIGDKPKWFTNNLSNKKVSVWNESVMNGSHLVRGINATDANTATDESGSDSEASASNGSSCSSFSDFEISDELSQQGKLKKDDIISEMKPLAEVLEFGEKASKKVSATRRSIKKLKSKFLDQSSKAFNEGLKTKPSDFPLPKDLKLNFNPEIAKVKSSTMDMKPPCDVKRVPKECDSESYQDSLYSNQVKSIYTSDVKLPPRNVLFNETMPQPLLPPLSPSRSGAISLPARTRSPILNARARMGSPRSPNFQAMQAVRSRSPARTPPSLNKPRSQSAIRMPPQYPISSEPSNLGIDGNKSSISDIPSTLNKSTNDSDIINVQPDIASISTNIRETFAEPPEPTNDNGSSPSSKMEFNTNVTKTSDGTPRSISPIIDKSWRSPMPTFKLGSTGHVTSGSISSAPGSITPIGSRRVIDSTSTMIGETKKPEITRTNSNASNLSNLSQSAQEIFMSISSDLTGLATQSTYALDEFFGIDQAAKSNWHRRNTSTRGYARYRSAVASGKSTKDYSAYRDNKSFLVEVIHRVALGEGISWMRSGRIKRLMEDECYRIVAMKQLRKSIDPKSVAADHVPDIFIEKNVWKGVLKLLQAFIAGFMVSYQQDDKEGIGSVFQMLELAHTHFTLSDQSSTGRKGSKKSNSPKHDSKDSPDEITASISLERIQSGKIGTEFPSVSDDVTRRTEIGSVTSIGDCSDIFDTDSQFIDSNQDVRPSNGGSTSNNVASKLLMCKSRKGGNYRFNSGCIAPTVPSSESGRLYLFEAVLSTASPVVPGARRGSILSLQGYGGDSNTIWKHMDFWETLFYDALSDERMTLGPIDEEGIREMQERYAALDPSDKKIVEEEEDKLLSTLIYNFTAYMIMMEVPKNEIMRRVRRLMGKCHVTILYCEEINTLLEELDLLSANDIDLKPVPSRSTKFRSFTVCCPSDLREEHDISSIIGASYFDNSITWYIMEVREDGLVLKTKRGEVVEHCPYDGIVNMTFSPKTKIICIWRRSEGITLLKKYHTKKCKDLYCCIKNAMQRAASKINDTEIPEMELGGEFPVEDIISGEGGLLQVCMEGIGVLFADRKIFVRLENIRKCYTQKKGIFVLEEFSSSTRKIIAHRYGSYMADQICYSVLCVFSFMAVGQQKSSK